MGTLLISIGVLVALRLCWYFLRHYVARSSLDDLPGPPSISIVTGNMLQLMNRNNWGFRQHLCDVYGPVSKIHGFFGAKWLHVYDSKALHYILVKDADSYYRGEESNTVGNLLLGPGLLSTYGDHHRKQRKMLNPVFSVAHMRNMTPMFYKICGKLHEAINIRVQDGPREVDVLGWMGRTALELVGQGGFGYSFDPLIAESKDSFTEAVKSFVPSVGGVVIYRSFFPYLKYLGPPRFRRFLLDMLPNRHIQRVKNVNDMVSSRAQEIFDTRKKAVESGDQELLHTISEGKDLMSIMLRDNMLASEEDKLKDAELLAQLSTFIVAGVDTTSNALARVLHLLALHQDVQEKLRAELIEAQETYGQDVPYDELSSLPYLDAVCRETLRLHAPVASIVRQARQDTVLPFADPVSGVNGQTITEIPVPKGTTIMAGVRACNTNKSLWGEDASEWKPERWLQPLPSAVDDARIPGIYAHLMTFIGGAHACIGFKFSQLEMKLVLLILVASYKFQLAEKPIVWNSAGVDYPTVSSESTQPEMYLTVSKA